MNLKFKNKKITGILTVVPDKERYFDDELDNFEFSKETSLKLKETMGYNKHRVVEDGTCVSDLALYGLKSLIERGLLKKEEIDALILVTETPDYIIPPTSNIIQGALELKEDMICLDINQGCAGYEIGLIQSFMMLEQEAINKVVLVNADLLGRKVSKRDRNSYPLLGDACAITIVEKSTEDDEVYANVKMDGKGAFVIQRPAGGLRLPCSAETNEMKRDAYGNWRSAENLVMKGDEVFMFVMKKVPALIKGLLEYSGVDKDEVDYYMFHQPNRFMLQKLAQKLKVPQDKMPSNIVENFGNSSGVTVPLDIAFNLGERMTKESMKLCLAGFGVGLVWSSIMMDFKPLDFCEVIEYPSDVKESSEK
jgi:3-oxoacyl-[acyl-carrier-protein] synthase-3